MFSYKNMLAAVALLAASTKAQNSTTASGSCPSGVTGNYSIPSAASGYSVRLIATGLTSPRGINFDSAGNLLVVEEGVGVTALSLSDDGGSCVSVSSQDTVVSDETLNHGIELSEDGSTLYASNSDKLYSWAYNADERTVTSDATTLVENMNGTDHTSRTLELVQSAPGMVSEIPRASVVHLSVSNPIFAMRKHTP